MEFFKTVGDLLARYWPKILSGAGITLGISLVGTLLGLGIGLAIGILRTMPEAKSKFGKICRKVLNFILAAYVEVFRGTPMMVQAMVIYWGYAFMSGGNTMNTYFAAVFIVSVNTGAYITEIVRGGINSIDKGQKEAATAIGMTHFQTMRAVLIPQAVKNILPAVSNEFVINVKDTSVLTVLIGFCDLYMVGKDMSNATLKTFESYLIICAVYFILTFTITRILRLFEKKLNGKANYRLYTSDAVGAAALEKK